MNTIATPVLIVGGGAAGMAAALALARRGVGSLIAERGPALGGQAARFCCKATETCARCGACRLGDLRAELATWPGIDILTQAAPSAARREGRGWRLTLAPQAGAPGADPLARRLTEETQVEAAAVILAVGHTPFNPQAKTRFGFGRVGGVTTAGKLEEALAQGGLPGGRPAGRIAFIQCVGSRDASLGRLWCSRVCCGFALRMARLIRHRWPQSEVTFFHMDIQGYGRAWEGELAAMRQDFAFVRAMPGEVAAGEAGPEVVYEGPEGTPLREAFDLVVLSNGLGPAAGAGRLAELFGAQRTEDGFIGLAGDPADTGAEGVFVAGCARGPLSIVESIDAAGLSAARAMAYLQVEGEAAHA